LPRNIKDTNCGGDVRASIDRNRLSEDLMFGFRTFRRSPFGSSSRIDSFSLPTALAKTFEATMLDIWGNLYRDFWHGQPKPAVIERDDGYCDEFEVDGYFGDPVRPEELELLNRLQGRVLDVACGVGRYALYLERRGVAVTAVDNSPGAIEVCNERGCGDARIGDMRTLSVPEGEYDAVIVMGNSLGAHQTLDSLPAFLKSLRRAARNGGYLLFTIIDPLETDRPEHLEYHRRNREHGRPPGAIVIRFKYAGAVDDWMDLLMPTDDELEVAVRGTGWALEEKRRSGPFRVNLYRAE
jgi:SAM-dependent methyltransferase